MKYFFPTFAPRFKSCHIQIMQYYKEGAKYSLGILENYFAESKQVTTFAVPNF